MLGLVTADSLVHSVWLWTHDHNLAYFSTFARVWEFGVGGILAVLAPHAVRAAPALRTAVSWLGLAAIIGPILTFREPESFPGLIVLLPCSARRP